MAPDTYPLLRTVHITAVILSGTLFTVRGLLAIGGSSIARHRVARRLSYGIDATLLAAAIALCALTAQYPLADAWLTAKVTLLVAYILLGWQALHGAHDRKRRLMFFAAALCVFGFMVGIARTHRPWGFLTSW
jgi:uncharacterized membrane protein SirB2